MSPREEALAAMVNTRLEQRKQEESRRWLKTLAAALACLLVFLGTNAILQFLLNYAGAGPVTAPLIAYLGALTATLSIVFALFPRRIAGWIALYMVAGGVARGAISVIRLLMFPHDGMGQLAGLIAAPVIAGIATLAVTIVLYRRQRNIEEQAERSKLREELRASRLMH